MTERDYPIGHPAASDYAGQAYVPPRAPFTEDFPPGHPARGGKNIDRLSTADGMRAEVIRLHKINAKRTAAAEAKAAQPAEQTPGGEKSPGKTEDDSE